MKDYFFSLPNLAFFRVSFPVVGLGGLRSIAPYLFGQWEDNLTPECLLLPRKLRPCSFWPIVLPLLSLVLVPQHVSTALTAVLSLGYNSGPKFHLWSQTSEKILLVAQITGQTLLRHFHSDAFMVQCQEPWHLSCG